MTVWSDLHKDAMNQARHASKLKEEGRTAEASEHYKWAAELELRALLACDHNSKEFSKSRNSLDEYRRAAKECEPKGKAA